MTDAFALSNVSMVAPRTAAGSSSTLRREGPAGSQLLQAWSSTPKIHGGARKAAEREYRVLFGMAFLVLLPVVAIGRLLPSRLRTASAAHRSILAEARAKADAVIPIVFMA